MLEAQEHILVSRECEETGELGLTFQSMRISNFSDGDIFVMFDALGIAHDLTEHVNGLSEIGSVSDEFEALGAIWYTRGQFSDLRRDNVGSAISTHEHVASDITRMASIAHYDGLHGHIAAQPESNFSDDIADIIKIAARDIPREYDDLSNWEGFKLGAYLQQAARGLALGVEKQRARFPNASDANNLFWNVFDAVSCAFPIEHEGAEFKLTITDDGRAFCEEWYGEVCEDCGEPLDWCECE